MKYLGIDYGLKRVGMAVSEGEIASPLEVINVSSLDNAFSKICDVVKKEKIDEVVIGTPESGVILRAARALEEKLSKRIKVHLIDETLSSQDAQKLLISQNISRKKRQAKIDSVSACIILQSFLVLNEKK